MYRLTQRGKKEMDQGWRKDRAGHRRDWFARNLEFKFLGYHPTFPEMGTFEYPADCGASVGSFYINMDIVEKVSQ